ncbi:MAG: polymer-forming cytoskeletal protein [Burkholderiales bacterium]|jgi:cytoskeletal protein CcmA (bactofilin family)|nr:polymer-forming cytoskeletal protein [Burkholderiales bacterium]
MMNRESFFKKREDSPAPRNVNVTPALGALGQPHDSTTRPAAPAITPKPETAQSPERAKSDVGSKLIVGPDIKLKGAEITDCDTLVVEGTVEASMDSRVVQIAEHGVFNGTVSIDIAEIRGRFDGELTAREQLIIHASGRVAGKIRYGKIKIEEGAEITGDVARIDRNDTRTLRATQPILKSAPA